MPLVGNWWHKLFMKIIWKLWLLWQQQGPIDLQGEILVISITLTILITSSWNLQERWTHAWNFMHGLLKKPLLAFVISITYSVLNDILKLADKVDMNEILDEYETWSDQIISLSYIPLTAELWQDLPEICRYGGHGWYLRQVKKLAQSDH